MLSTIMEMCGYLASDLKQQRQARFNIVLLQNMLDWVFCIRKGPVSSETVIREVGNEYQKDYKHHSGRKFVLA